MTTIKRVKCLDCGSQFAYNDDRWSGMERCDDCGSDGYKLIEFVMDYGERKPDAWTVVYVSGGFPVIPAHGALLWPNKRDALAWAKSDERISEGAMPHELGLIDVYFGASFTTS